MTIKWIDETHYWRLPSDTDDNLHDEFFNLAYHTTTKSDMWRTTLGKFHISAQFDDYFLSNDEAEIHKSNHRYRTKCWHEHHPFYKGEITQTEPDIIVDVEYDYFDEITFCTVYMHDSFTKRETTKHLSQMMLKLQLQTKEGSIKPQSFDDQYEWQFDENIIDYNKRLCKQGCADWWTGNCCKYAKGCSS